MINSNLNQAAYAKAQQAYHDFEGLKELKQGARADDPEALKEVARQFEALFIQMIMKSARDADELIGGEENLFRSKEMSFFQTMLDEQYSIALSQAGRGSSSGLGIADVLVRQLSKNTPQEKLTEVTDKVLADAKQLTDEIMAKLNLRKLSTSQQQLTKSTETTPPLTAAQNAVAAAPAPELTKDPTTEPAKQAVETQALASRVAGWVKKSFFASPKEFVEHIYPLAKEAAQKLGVDPKLLVAQTALETGWGKYMVAKEDGSSSFNLFNIKADSRWQGDAAETQTLEYRNGEAQQERWAFRAYASLEDSMQDYINFLQTSPRYAKALENSANPQAFITGLQQAGYATDPNYAKKILNLMESPRLAEALQAIE